MTPAPGAGRKRTLVGVVVIGLAVLAAYAPALNAGFIWDDDDYVTENVHLRTMAGLGRIWFDLGATHQYYPAVHTSFWLEYQLWGPNPLGFHLDNILLHAVGAVLLWFVLRRLCVPGAWLAAAIFALHPVQVESVAWITERKNVLSAVFYFASLLALVRFLNLPADRPSPNRRWGSYTLGVLLFCAALLSKSVTCTLPAVVLLLLWWKRRSLGSRDLLPLIPLFALGAAMGLVTIWMEKHTVGAQGEPWNLTFLQRFLVAGRVIWFYLGKLVWPARLTFIYPRWQIDAGLWWQYLYPLAALAVPVALWLLRRRLGRGPLVAALFFGGTLFPALGFFDVFPMRYSFVADHFQYLAAIGPIVLFAALLTSSLGLASASDAPSAARAASRPVPVVVRSVGPALVLAVLAVLTWKQCGIYGNAETLWRDTLAKNPSAWMAHNNLGRLLQAQGKNAEAIDCYEEALRLKPDLERAHGNLAAVLLLEGRIEEAIPHAEEALRLWPDFAGAHFCLAKAWAAQGKTDQAIAAFARAVELDDRYAADYAKVGITNDGSADPGSVMEFYQLVLSLRPDDADARAKLAAAMTAAGHPEQALDLFRQALAADPENVEARTNYALALTQAGRLDEAFAQYEQVLQANPTAARAHAGLADTLARRWQDDDAIAHYRRSLQIDPDSARTHNNLGRLLAQSGQFDEALEHFTEAVRLEPDYATAHYNLGGLLAQMGRLDEAISEFETVLQIDPHHEAAAQALARVKTMRPQR